MRRLSTFFQSLQTGIVSGCLVLGSLSSGSSLAQTVSSASQTDFTAGEARYERVFDAGQDSYQVEADKSMQAKELAEYYGVIVAESGAAAGQLLECYGTPDPDDPKKKKNPESFDMFADIQSFEKFSEQVERIRKRLLQNEILLAEENGCKDEQINELLRTLKLQELYIQVIGSHKERLRTVSTLLYAAAAQANAEDLARMADIDRGEAKIDSGRAEVAVGWGMVGSGITMLAASQKTLPPASVALAIVGTILISIGTALVDNGRAIQRDGERKLRRGKFHLTMTCPFSGCYEDAYTYRFHVFEPQCKKPNWEESDDLFGKIAEVGDPSALPEESNNQQTVQTLPTTYNQDKNKKLSHLKSFVRDFIEAEALAQSNNEANTESISGTTDIDSPANGQFIDELNYPVEKTYQVMSIMPNTRTKLYDKLAQDSEYATLAADRIIQKLEAQRKKMMDLLLKLKRELKGDIGTTDGTQTRNNACEEAINKFQSPTRGVDSLTQLALKKAGKAPALNFKATEFRDPGLTTELNTNLKDNAEKSNRLISLSLSGSGNSAQARDLANSISTNNQNLQSGLATFERNTGIANLETNNAIRNNISSTPNEDGTKKTENLASNGVQTRGEQRALAAGLSAGSRITNNNQTLVFDKRGPLSGADGVTEGQGPKTNFNSGGRGDLKEKEQKSSTISTSALFKKVNGQGLGLTGLGKLGASGLGQIGRKKGESLAEQAKLKSRVAKERSFSGNELEHMRKNHPKRNPRYKESEYDSLWDQISKAYFREGIPRLFDIKKK